MAPTEPPKQNPDRPDAVHALGNEDVDDGLILWMLSLTPLERLQVLQDFVDSVTALRNARRV